ncbi:hypothetical protein JVX98_25410 [Ensifer sp. PDNC004]|uniref:hypothetical protein n=1 Tax=unclassified Ensifer TaxID=2633371 RepID=UPI00177D1505|nr:MULTISPECIES: hypothetical protein [unclassified Ensifer]MBD9652152.1 hypothetical protein [Ensifer sp. ENS09]QRY67656.1 hypothetical protein JVX98_25410 [Ensifer sp. PDNC004]
MSVLAVLAFSDTFAAARRRARRWAADLLLVEAPAEVPADRPLLLRDAGIPAVDFDLRRRERMLEQAVYRSHWML